MIDLEDLLAFEARMKDFMRALLAKGEQLQGRPSHYTTKGAAEATGLSRAMVRKFLCDKDEPHMRGVQTGGVRKTWLIPRESVDAWIKANRREAK